MSTKQTPTFTLYRGWPTPDQLVWSPFVIKVELRLRAANVAYKAEGGSTSQSPRGKIPYMTIHCDGQDETLSDSTLIITRLVHEQHLPDLNGQLTPAQRLEDLSLRALLEEKLYFYHMHERWVLNYRAHRDHVLSHLSLPLRIIAGALAYRSVLATLHGQGTGRLDPAEIDALRSEIWRSIDERLGSVRKSGGEEEPFWVLGGTGPTEADMSLFGFVVSVLVATSCPRSQEVVRGCANVIDYVGRIYGSEALDGTKAMIEEVVACTGGINLGTLFIGSVRWKMEAREGRHEHK